MEQKYTPIERLDILLFFIVKQGHDYLEIEHGIWDRLLKDIPDLYIGVVPSHRIQMLRKLVKDGYVEKEEGKENYRIAFNGIIFEGYIKDVEKAQRQKKNQNLKDFLLISGAWMASLAGAGLLYFEYIKLNHHLFHGLRFWHIFAGVSILVIPISILILCLKPKSMK